MQHIDISIIVPVYNAQAYIGGCLSSLQAQTFRNWECICVDDGSSDQSPDIVERFVAQDSRFRLIKQTNGGPGAARNTGLEAVQGEYFTFVDADDLVHPEMLERLLDLSRLHSADLVVCGFFYFKSDDEFHELVRNPDLLLGETEVHAPPLLSGLLNWKQYRVHPWGKLHQREMHGRLCFPHLFGPEDDYASFDVYGRSERAVFSPMRLYGYRLVEEGLVRSVSKYRNYIIGDAQVAMHCEAVCSEHGVDNVVKAQLVTKYVKRIFGYLNEMSIDERLSKNDKKDIMESARDGLQNIKRCVAGKYRIVPLVHSVPYIAVRLSSLWLLVYWQWVRLNILKKMKSFFQKSAGKGNDVV